MVQEEPGKLAPDCGAIVPKLMARYIHHGAGEIVPLQGGEAISHGPMIGLRLPFLLRGLGWASVFGSNRFYGSDQLMTAHERLRELFQQRALQFGDFTLASGRKSRYYINSKQVLFHSEALALLGECLYEASADVDCQAFGGMEVGAIPMTAAVLLAYHQRGQSREGFFVRKQAKEHGSRERLEGRVQAGDRVVVLEDVLTTGKSVSQAIEAVEGRGAHVVRVLAICDRLEGAAQTLARYDVRSLFTIRDFGLSPEES
jgi:orotate phosphoribosyltransferase